MLKKTPLNIKRLIHPTSNAVCGVFLKLLKPFKKGDFIEVRGKLGAVKSRGIKKTILSESDGTETALNNTVFYTGSFHNITAENIVQLKLKVRVQFQSDMIKVKEGILNFLDTEQLILSTPKTKIKAGKIDQNHIELIVTPWCTLNDYEKLNNTLETAVTLHLSHQGFSLVSISDNHIEPLA